MTHDTRHTQLHATYHYLRVVVASLVLCLTIQSCNKQSHPLTPEEDVAISMNATSVEGMETSRALITDDRELQAVGFGVYATKQVASNNPVLVFNNVNVKYETTEGWDYSPKRYWDRTATYNFVAYAPYSIKESTSYVSSTNTNILTISNIPYWQEIGNNTIDYLVANSSGTAENYLSNTTSTAVSFKFSHILSQFIVHIVKDGNFAHTKYKVTKVEYINVPVPAEGSTATYNYTSEAGFMETISINDETAPLSKLNDTNGKDVTSANATSGKITLSHLVVPFSLTDKNIKIKITYTVEGTERTKTVDTGIKALTANNMYELTLTFRGAEIDPELAVKVWVNQTVDEDPKYNW